MRVRITDASGHQTTFPSIALACQTLGVKRSTLVKQYSIVRLYEKGYWMGMTDHFKRTKECLIH